MVKETHRDFYLTDNKNIGALKQGSKDLMAKPYPFRLLKCPVCFIKEKRCLVIE